MSISSLCLADAFWLSFGAQYNGGVRRPWNNLAISIRYSCFKQVYNIPDALFPEAPMDPSVFLNGKMFTVGPVCGALTNESSLSSDQRTRSAIHAPTTKNWTLNIVYPFGNGLFFHYLVDSKLTSHNYICTDVNGSDPSKCFQWCCWIWFDNTYSAGVEQVIVFFDIGKCWRYWSIYRPMAFLTELATNATKHNLPIVIYSGNDDSLVPHRGTEGQSKYIFPVCCLTAFWLDSGHPSMFEP